MKPSLGLYLHIPFCVQKCRYCDFCSFPSPTDRETADYTEELCRRLAAFAPQAADYEVDTVYFGGGTPTLLAPSLLIRLLETVRSCFSLSPRAEITCECNPATVVGSDLEALRRGGFNRLSLGLQSAHDEELALLGRAHSVSDFLHTYGDARRAGFDNVSVDLMYGLPDQTLSRFERSLETVLALEPEHLSAYGLKLEEGTPFYRMRHRLSFPDEDTEFAMYERLAARAEDAGLLQYEVSNFARKGMESRHNLRYWRRQDYVGFGPAAHSCFGGLRFGNSRDLKAFLRGEDTVCERETLDGETAREETVMLSLRLREGLSLSDYRRRFGRDLERERPILSRFEENGLLRREGDRISLTTKGFFVSNAILAELI